MPKRRSASSRGQYEFASAEEADVRRFVAHCQSLSERPVVVFRLALQALEARLAPLDAIRFRHNLQRLVCVPVGTGCHQVFAPAELPPLPDFDPPLGCPDPIAEEDDEPRLAVVPPRRAHRRRGHVVHASYTIGRARPLSAPRRLTFRGTEEADVKRLNALRHTVGGTNIEVFRAAMQALEADLSPSDALRFRETLKRLVCSPAGTAVLPIDDLPPLPSFDPPLGCPDPDDEEAEEVSPLDSLAEHSRKRILRGHQAACLLPPGIRKTRGHVEEDVDYEEDEDGGT